MKEVTIYEFQIKHILDVLNRASRIHESNKLETCFDRDVIQAKKYAENAIAEKKDEFVMRGVN